MSTTITKALRKEIVKNHLAGLDEDQNLKKIDKKGGQIDKQAIRGVIDEFGEESERKGLDTVSRSIGVSRLANELGEVASFKRKNGVDLVEMMQGAKVAKILKDHGTEISELENFLSTIYSRAKEKGYSPEALVSQIAKLNDLEKKYDASFLELKTQYDKIGSEIKAKANESNRLGNEIADLKRRREAALAKFEVEERNMEEYAQAREKLLSLGFDIDNLNQIKEFLLATKSLKLDPKDVVSKLTAIGDLEKEISKLEQEMNLTNEELRWKKALLSEVRKLEETKLSIEQVENIKKIVLNISSEKGIETSRAYAQFEEDVLTNYSASLGMRANLTRLQEEEKLALANVDKAKEQLAANEAEHAEKLKKIDERYSKIAGEIKAYNDLKEMGIDSNKILSWHDIMQNAQLDFSSVESQLKNYANLKNLEKEINQKIVGLMAEASSLRESISSLSEQKLKVESSIKAISESAVSQVDSTSSKILSSLAGVNEKLQTAFAQMAVQNEKKLTEFTTTSVRDVEKATEQSRVAMENTLTSLNSAVSNFSLQLNKALEEAAPQMKSVSEALEAGQKLGQYRNILPLLQLAGDNQVSESEALIAMWNLTNKFGNWVSEHYRSSPRTDISTPLSKLASSINEEIQRVNSSNV